MHYIYCFENKLNGHKYIGQTNNLQTRYSAHKSQSFNPNSKDYFCLFHQKIREYGIDNFNFYVLEEISNDDQEFIDFREQYWIEKEKTWARYGQGYNQNTGGTQYKKSLPLTDDQLQQIRTLIKTTELSFTQIAQRFNTYRDCISFINKGIYGFSNVENYPLRITREWREIPQEIKEEIALLLKNTKIPYKELMIKYGVSEHFLCQLNNGETNLSMQFDYPLRKANQRLTKAQEDIILQGLQAGDKIKDIASRAGVSRDTVSRRKQKYKNLNL